MRILHMISSGGMYGAEAVILNMSRTLNEGSHRSLIASFSNSSNPNLQLHQAALKQGLDSHLIPCNGQIDRKVVGRIREIISLTQPDVVHAHGYKADIYLYLALRGSRTALVSTCHTWYDNDPMVFLYGVLDRMVLSSFARVVAVSEDVKQRLLKAGVKAGKVALISNGIDLRPFDGAPAVLKAELGWSDRVLIGLVGRLAVEKGVDIFFHAAARVLAQRPEARFVVAGDGPDRAELEALIGQLGIRESVRLLGRRDDMPSVYASLDVMVSASRREGLPIALLEGMASRRPLVATAVGEIPAVLKNGITGTLVPAENPELLAEAIIDLVRDQAKRERYGAEARRVVEEEFSAERMTADYLRVYQEAVADVAARQGRPKESPLASRGKTT